MDTNNIFIIISDSKKPIPKKVLDKIVARENKEKNAK